MNCLERIDPQSVDLPWVQIVKQKRQEQMERISSIALTKSSSWEIFSSIDDVQTLVGKIATGELTAVDVASAFMERAMLSHEKTNCLTEILWDSALAQAKELDAYYQEHGKTVGPLHGLPVTLKDQFDVKGYDSTLGYVGNSFHPATDDALLVKILRQSGAIFLAKSNLPQSIMWCETDNPLWGLTTNPRDAKLTPGGSTGGEAVLLAERGSILGWGTDIGGSVRIPAHMMGVYGLKPSSGRLPYLGVPVSTEGQEHVPSAVGPMARSLSSIELVTRLIINSKPWESDPACHRLPWQESVYLEVQSRPLTIGLLIDDGYIRCHPAIERVVKEAAAKLQSAGHTIIPWSPDGHTECIEIMDQYYTADGGKDILTSLALAGEPPIPHVQALTTRAPAISVYEYWQLNRRKRQAQAAYLKRWSSNPSDRRPDVLLTPVMPHPSIPHQKCKWVGYTKVWNLLDYTALMIPGGKVDKNVDPRKDDEVVRGYVGRNPTDRANWELYDVEAMDGLPIGLQIVGGRLEEEKVLGAGKVIESVLRMEGP